MKRLRNWLLFLSVVLIWASNWAVMKIGLKYVSPLNFVLDRFLLSSLALSPLLIFLRERIPHDKETLVKLFLLGVINAVCVASTNIGLVYEKSGISAILTYTQPLFVFCFALSFLKEKAGISKLLGVFIGFSGVVALSIGESNPAESLSYPVFFLLMGAFLWAVTIVYYKKLLSHVDPVVTNAVQLTASAILLAPLASAFEGLSFPLTHLYILIILYTSVFASAIGLTLWVFLLREEDATVLSSSSFMIPIVALFFGWLLIGENVELKSLLSIGLVASGVYLVNKS